MGSFPRAATKNDLKFLQDYEPLNADQERLLVDTPDGYLLRTFSGRPRDWLRLYKRLLRKEAPDHVIATSLKEAETRREKAVLEAAYGAALKQITDLERQVDVLSGFDTNPPRPLPSIPKIEGKREAALVVALSDMHAAEEIMSSKVGGMNAFNLDICQARMAQFTESVIKLWKREYQGGYLNTLVLALLGDLCNGELREESVATNLLGPIDEVYFVQSIAVSVINRLIDMLGPDTNILIPVVYGNHSRLTDKVQYKRLKETSTEYILGRNLHSIYADVPNVHIELAGGSQAIIDLFGHRVRAHHGMAFQYNRGMGGIEPVARRTIHQWNRAQPCIMDMFGHWHLFNAPYDYLGNGSVCGYNEFAIGRGFAYQPPLQAATLIDSYKGRRGSWPIYLGD